MKMNNIKCPKCGASHFWVNNSVSTTLYSPIEYLDGEIISNDPNYHTYNCTCAECGELFSYTIHQGELYFEPMIDVTEIVISNEEADKMRANIINSIPITELNLDGRTITIEGKDINKGSITN